MRSGIINIKDRLELTSKSKYIGESVAARGPPSKSRNSSPTFQRRRQNSVYWKSPHFYARPTKIDLNRRTDSQGCVASLSGGSYPDHYAVLVSSIPSQERLSAVQPPMQSNNYTVKYLVKLNICLITCLLCLFVPFINEINN